METIKAAPLSENQQHEPKTQRKIHVLAVDDSHIERKILEKLLTISSYQVTAVESGNKALEYLGLLGSDDKADSCEKRGDGMMVNLIMTDYSMPGMTGYDLLKRLKGSSWRDVPVILMSSENVPSRIHMCLEEGADEFLLKPVRLSDLMKLQDYVRSVCVEDSNLRDKCNEKFDENVEERIAERRMLVDTANSID